MPSEIEIKLDLQNEDNYKRLLNRLGPPVRRKSQMNHFFDTADRGLLKSKWALRLRQEDDNCTMALKGSEEGNRDGLAIRKEYETSFECRALEKALKDGLELSDCPEMVESQLRSLKITGILGLILTFHNERISLKYADRDISGQIELDKTRFSDDSVEFELEMELIRPDEYPAAFESLERLLGESHIPVRGMNESKFIRAFKRSHRGHLYRET
jgi:uncharacterized protein YjbK